VRTPGKQRSGEALISTRRLSLVFRQSIDDLLPRTGAINTDKSRRQKTAKAIILISCSFQRATCRFEYGVNFMMKSPNDDSIRNFAAFHGLRLLASIALIALAIGSPESSLAQSTFQGLGFLPNTNSSRATGISADGTTVSGYATPGGNSQAFQWTTGGGMIALPLIDGIQSHANATNANGSVIVGDSEPPANAQFPVVWSGGAGTTLSSAYNSLANPPALCGAQVNGVNANATSPTNSIIVGQDGLNSPPGGGRVRQDGRCAGSTEMKACSS